MRSANLKLIGQTDPRGTEDHNYELGHDRAKRVAKYLDKEDFCFTYGDGLADVVIAGNARIADRAASLATRPAH